VHVDALAAAVLVTVVAGDVEVELPLPDFEPQAASPATSEAVATVNRILRIRSATPESMDRESLSTRSFGAEAYRRAGLGCPAVKDLTVVAIPVYFGSMGAEYLWLRDHSDDLAAAAAYERQDTVSSLTTGVLSLAAGFQPRLINTARGVNLLYQFWIHT